MSDYGEYYAKNLADGQDFEDFCVWALLHYAGLVSIPFRSKHWQRHVGESQFGVEVKLDKKSAKTGNLWIELWEKSSPDQPEWTTSGILRSDSCWLYAIGDHSTIYVFTKKCLERRAPKELKTNGTQTSKGYILPTREAKQIAGTVIVIKKEDIPDGLYTRRDNRPSVASAEPG